MSSSRYYQDTREDHNSFMEARLLLIIIQPRMLTMKHVHSQNGCLSLIQQLLLISMITQLFGTRNQAHCL